MRMKKTSALSARLQYNGDLTSRPGKRDDEVITKVYSKYRSGKNKLHDSEIAIKPAHAYRAKPWV
ncbi:unnamed protein product [Ceratitis capitata]|uniref:(Mediterranean fruit fly) hypothetical protein n=1 Tax=Ceratitis capitata TaxID=7213 RepID=A0A811V003_CERCA|nr:unnamed protein product [Ceratitis capitata]